MNGLSNVLPVKLYSSQVQLGYCHLYVKFVVVLNPLFLMFHWLIHCNEINFSFCNFLKHGPSLETVNWKQSSCQSKQVQCTPGWLSTLNSELRHIIVISWKGWSFEWPFSSCYWKLAVTWKQNFVSMFTSDLFFRRNHEHGFTMLSNANRP